MKPTATTLYGVRAQCPDCDGAICIFDFKDSAETISSDVGSTPVRMDV